jgi:hypothetical protein
MVIQNLEEDKMPAGNTVRPQKWSNVIDLYDATSNVSVTFYTQEKPRLRTEGRKIAKS